ncbi:MAG: hypothetical protein JSW25_05590 [Thermoplasmata archaeon]|nr:MAG: hypothetical protein JSW25_05590 [Thermoplasmata archaeon]
MRRITAVTLILMIAVLALVAVGLATNVAAVDEWTDNENSGDARWLESGDPIGPVHIWKKEDDVNTDWFKFNASEGEHIEIRFRKYTENPTVPGLLGYTYYIKWDLWGPYVPGRNVYSYAYTYPGQGQPNDRHRRDSFSMVVDENLGGIYFIRVWVDPPNQNPYRDHAYYWLNVTTSEVDSLDTQSSYSGFMQMYRGYNINYNFEDYYSINLDATSNSGDKVLVTLTKDYSDHNVFVEVWSEIPYGLGQNDHMLNRTYYEGTTLRIEFTAPHTGEYYIRVYRSFWNAGSTGYGISVYVDTGPLEGNEVANDAVSIPKKMTVTSKTIEMGYDTHDWYACDIKDGDKVFDVILTLRDPNLSDGHGVELVVYNDAGQVMWSRHNRYRVGDDYAWHSTLELPPAGTTTFFDRDQIYFVRVSIDPSVSASGVTGFTTLYDIEFNLANRAPVLVVPFEEMYQWDEDEGISIELDSHFSDIDGDSMEYTVFNKTTGFVVDNDGLDDGWLNITSPENWNGEVWWRLRAVDEGQGETHFIFIDFRFRVNPVPDRPLVNESLTATCEEEGTCSVDLKDLFYDVDEGPGGVLTFGLFDSGITEVAVTVDPHSGLMEMVPGPDVFGVFTFDVWCYDNVPEQVMGEVELTINPINDIPRIVGPIDPLELDEGDVVAREIDLSPYFVDVDGDDLTYTFDVPVDMRNYVSVIHKNNVLTESTLVIKVLDPYFYATFPINITCTDPTGTLVQQDLLVDITPVPNAPEILYTPVGNPSNIDETQSLVFEVTDVLDHDEPEMGHHTFTWVMDGTILAENGTQFIYRPDFDSAGIHEVSVTVTDPFGLSAEASWSFQVTNVNRKPTATITTIPTALTTDEKIVLSVDAQDPDDDALVINWYLTTKNDKLLGTGPSVETKLPAGTHIIEVEVIDDGGEKSVDTFSIKVTAVEDESNIGMLLGIIVAVVVIVLIAVVALRMRAAPSMPEASIDIESLQKEYDPSGGTTPDYGEEYNPMPQYDQDEYDRLQ